MTFGPLIVAAPPSAAFELLPISPNPVRAAVRIEYALPREMRVRLSVLDVQGRCVAVLAEGVRKAGRYVTTWDGRSGRDRAGAGVFFVRYEAAGLNWVRSLALAR